MLPFFKGVTFLGNWCFVVWCFPVQVWQMPVDFKRIRGFYCVFHETCHQVKRNTNKITIPCSVSVTLKATCTMSGTSAVSTEKISGTVSFSQNVRINFTDPLHLTPEYSIMFCSGGEFLSVNKCFQWDRVPSILPMRTKSQGNEVILSTNNHSNLIRTTPLLIKSLLSKFKTKN